MRIRSTKPEFWRSKLIASVSWDARFVLKALESYVDDNGVGEDDVNVLVGDCFLHDLIREPSRTLARVSEAISELHRAGLVWRYASEGRNLLYVSFWESVQRIDKAQSGRNPRPDGTLNYKESVIRECVANVREHSRGVAPGTGEQGNRGTGEQRNSVPPTGGKKRASSLPDDWTPSEACIKFATENGIDLDHEQSQFKNHAEANARKQANWDAAFRQWLGNAKKWARPAPALTTSKAEKAWDFVNSLEETGGTQRGGDGAGPRLELRQ